MKRVCSNCGHEFETKSHRQTCSFLCARARQNKAIREMREKKGEIYIRWHNALQFGIAAMSERKSKEKAR